MDYQKHYNTLILRAQTRTIGGYTERHHILPKCLGGSNSKENLVKLTPEEHYVAHQLLVKMHPGVDALVYAANKMTVTNSTTHQRSNKRYGWLKKKYRAVCTRQVGEKNSSYGKSWYHDPVTLSNGKFPAEQVPAGWVLGRVPPKVKATKPAKEIKRPQSCGLNNSQAGTQWVNDGFQNMKTKIGEVPEGWKKGRLMTMIS